jgi:hydrogenase maturation protein HypF
MLAMGAQLKNSIALSVGRDVFISQHIGDLETTQAYDAFRRVIKDFQRLYGVTPLHFACDAHPEYLSTKYARENPTPLVSVQHHIAHVAACMAENEIETPVLGVAWDGTGFGLDGTIWGGEFFRMHNRAIERVAHFRAFALPGGEQAIKEPRRSAIGTLYEVFGDALFAREDMASVQVWSTQESVVLQTMLKKKINTPRTSSVGRLFDAVAALTGLRQETKFEGQAAMELEFALDGIETDATYDFDIIEANRSAKDSSVIIDWEPMIRGIIAEVQHSVPIGTISAKFHNTLVETIVAIAKRMNEERIVLSGGCFQNKYLTERAVQRLREEGFRPYWHQRIPPNDGGIALGQIAHITNNR